MAGILSDVDLHALAGVALATSDVDDELAVVDELTRRWAARDLRVDPDAPVLDPRDRRAPARPVLVATRRLAARGYGTVEGRIASIHAVAHIEANAVDLALDAVHRFRGLPTAFYDDWVRVAAEEARHFRLLRGRLAAHGAAYGDLPAHAGLWEACARTADDPLRRMALVPRVLEARGLDVNPPMVARFRDAGDEETAAVLARILEDEVGHVAVGDRWFRHLCAARGVEPEATFAALLAEAGVRVRPPLNVDARLAAGFSPAELSALASDPPPR
jgi:uncharacterized ferritin-like protein (DUF455 family)